MQIRLVGSRWGLLAVVLFFAAGCDSRPTRVPVSGKVFIDGEPLKYGAVVFVPDGGRQSTGIIDAMGNFKLTCFEPGDGALVGTHHVQVLSGESINNTTIKWYAPKKYADRRTSGLVQEIKGATDSVVINLTWKGNTPDKPFTEHAEADAGEEAFGRTRGKK
jgi:hypothetical protein